MQFFASAITTLQTLVIAPGAGIGVWGGINLLEGYGQDNPASKAQGVLNLLVFLFGFLANSPNLFIRAGIAAIWISNSSRR